MKFKKFDGWFVTLGNNSVAKIIDKGTLSIDGGKTKIYDVLYVGLKHNLLNVSQMCDKGYNISFNANGCEIRKSSTNELIMEGSMNDSDVYHLNEVNGRNYVVI